MPRQSERVPNETADIQITDGMLRAGRQELLHYDRRFHLEDTLLSCLFEAMVNACPDLKGRRVVHDHGALE